MSDSSGDVSVRAKARCDVAEAAKLTAERYKLLAEADKLRMDRAVAP
jgi:hypothetical protein